MGRPRGGSRPTRPAPGAWRRFAGAVGALVVVAVGIPALLVVCARVSVGSWHPVPGIGSWEEIQNWFERQGLSSTEMAGIAVRALLVVAWLLWLGMLLSVLSAIAASRPRLERVRLPRLAVFDGLGGWVAAGLTALSSLTPNFSSAAAAPSPPAPVVQMVESATPTRSASPVRLVTGRVGWERVQHGESIEMFAARTLGDPARWTEVWELNEGCVMDEAGTVWREPWRLSAGWELELPHDRPSPASDRPGPSTATLGLPLGADGGAVAEASAGSGHVVDVGVVEDPAGFVVELPAPAGAAQHTVVAGESYWSIAEQVLAGEWGRAPSQAEVLAYTVALRDHNAPLLGHADPSMLHPGDVLSMIPTGATPVSPATVPWPPPADPPAAPTAPPPAPVETTPPPPAGVEQPAVDAAPAPPPMVDPTVTVPPPVEPPVEQPDRPPASAPSAPTPQPAPAATDTPIPATHVLAAVATVTVAGVATVYRHRRRRAATRGRPHQRPAPLPGEMREVAAEVVYRDVSDVTWMGLELRWLAHNLEPAARSVMAVQLVQLNPERHLEVAFMEIPASSPPAGWTAAAERVWRLDASHDPATLDPLADLPPVLPALVTLGDGAEGGQVYLNVEAVGGLNVSGDEAAVSAWVANVVWEIAGEALGEGPDVILVDVDDHVAKAAGQLGRVRQLRGPDAVEAVAGTGAAAQDSAMLGRRVNQWDAWPTALVVLGAGAPDGAWDQLAARPDVGVLAIGGGLSDGVSVELADGELRVPQWRLRVPATQLDEAALDAVCDLLEVADADPVADEDEIPTPTPDTPLLEVVADGDEEPWEAPSWPVMVSVLGEPEATRDEEPLALTPQRLAALAFLAIERDVSIDAFCRALWGDDVSVKDERIRKRIRDLLSETRKAVGGDRVVCHVDDDRVRAGPDLGSDLAVFEALNHRAQETPAELAPRFHEIMYLLRGPAFAIGDSVAHHWRWVDDAHLQAHWELRTSTVAWELGRLYLDRDDPAAARDIAERGLAANPLHDALTQLLMLAYEALGAPDAAQRVYESHDRALTARDLGPVSEQTRRVLERIRAAAHRRGDIAAVGS